MEETALLKRISYSHTGNSIQGKIYKVRFIYKRRYFEYESEQGMRRLISSHHIGTHWEEVKICLGGE
jgi:hypothetical protein